MTSPNDPKIRPVIRNLFADVLATPATDDETGFFDLGGTSVDALELIDRLHGAFGVSCEVTSLYTNGSVTHVTELVGDKLHESGRPTLPAIEQSADRSNTEAALTQRQLLLRQAEHPTTPLSLMRRDFFVDAQIETSALEEVAGRLIRRHEALRTGYRVHGETIRLFPRPSELGHHVQVTFSEADFNDAAGAPFDHSSDDFLRLVLYHGSGQQRLSLVTDHLVADGASLAIIESELVIEYNAVLRGLPAAAPPALQWIDYLQWANDSKPAIAQARHAWESRIAGRTLSRIPFSPGATPQVAEPHGHSAVIKIPHYGRPLTALALAAGAQAFSRVYGGPDFVACVPVLNRQPGLARSVGRFSHSTLVWADRPDRDFSLILDHIEENLRFANRYSVIPVVNEIVEQERAAGLDAHGQRVLFQVHGQSRPPSPPGLGLDVKPIPARSEPRLMWAVVAELQEQGDGLWLLSLMHSKDAIDSSLVGQLTELWAERLAIGAGGLVLASGSEPCGRPAR